MRASVCFLVALSLMTYASAGGGLSRTDSLITASLEGSNTYPRIDVLMEGISLVTPFVEWGSVMTGFRQGSEERELALTLGEALVTTQFLAVIVKYTIRRERPTRRYRPRLWNTRITPSFPSGHAVSSAAFAAFVAGRQPKYGPLLATYVAASAYSQVYVGNHYAGDVAAGILLGWAVGRWFLTQMDESSTNNQAQAVRESQRIATVTVSVWLN